MAFLNKNIYPRSGGHLPPISKSSMGTPFFISFLGFTYIELQVNKLLPKSECRFYLGGMTLKAFKTIFNGESENRFYTCLIFY